MASEDALLAAVTLPKFKLRWIAEDTRKDEAKMLLAAACRAVPADEPHSEEPVPPRGEDDFFSFTPEEPQGERVSVDTEISDYLKSGHEMTVLNKFPRIKQVSLRLNTPTPSSAPVERLFSLGGLILVPRRNRLTKNFERLLLMRYNKTFDNFE